MVQKRRGRRPQPSPLPKALAEPWTDANPWTDQYLNRELAVMQDLPPFDEGGVQLTYGRMDGVVDCYLRRDLVEWGPFPKLLIDNTLWMSMTPQEIESQYMPIRLAEGRVGIGGLGLGYAAARIASKPDVTEVVVYETNPTIIRLWQRNFGSPEKVRVVEQDVATIRGEHFDLFFNDVYASMWEDATWEHWNVLTDWNDIGWYHPWGIEAYLLALIVEKRQGEIPPSWRWTYLPYLQQLLDAVNHNRRNEPDWVPHGVLEIEARFPSIESVDRDLGSLRSDLWEDAA